MPPRKLLALVLVGMVALSGCGTLPSAMVARVPTSGPIQQGEQITTQTGEQIIRVIARGPQPGMSIPQIVRGFLDASASFDGDHAVARQYLTERAGDLWEPSAGVRVYEGVGEISASVNEAVFEAPEVGRISALGHFDVGDRLETLSAPFTLVQENGEWRIEELADGLLLSRADVDRSFRAQSVYFFTPEFSTLVPDMRIVPALDAGQATSLVRLLLAGPTEWLEPAVRTGFPDNVGLNVDSVPVDGGIASVDLTASALTTSDRVRQAMSQQLVWTLRQLPGIEAVRITAAGTPFSVPGVGTPQPISSWPAVSPDRIQPGSTAYVVRGSAIWSLESTGEAVKVSAGIDAVDAPLIDIAVSPRANALAGVDALGRLWLGPVDEESVLTRDDTIGRVFDVAYAPSGTLWVLQAGNRITAVNVDGAREDIALPWTQATDRVLRAVPSRDGARAALVVARTTGTELLMARVVQRPGVTGVVLEDPRRVESVLADVGDVAWADAEQLAIVGRLDAEGLATFSVDLGQGRVTPLGGPGEPIAIAAAPGLPLLAQVADTISARTAGAWLAPLPGTAPTYPG